MWYKSRTNNEKKMELITNIDQTNHRREIQLRREQNLNDARKRLTLHPNIRL